MKNKQGHSAGFTLIEVLVSLVILLFGIIGVMSMQYNSVAGSRYSKELMDATSRGRDVIERLRTIPFKDVVALDNQTSCVIGVTCDTDTSGVTEFSRRWWVVKNCSSVELTNDDAEDPCNGGINATCSNDCLNGSCAVDSKGQNWAASIFVRTCWTDKDGNPHSISLQTVRWTNAST